MKCTAYENQIALYVEADLSASDRRRVETHLQSCTACNALAEDLRESQSMFKALRAATVNSSDLAGVRERVLNEVGGLEPAPGWVVTMHRVFFAGMRRRNAIAGVLLAALISGSVWYSHMRIVHEVREEAPVDVAKFETPVPIGLQTVAQPSGETPRIVKSAEPLEIADVLPAEAAEVQVVEELVPPESQVSQIPMKFVTDDPDIIIYWLPSDKGD
jgi:hypothetical protein